MLVSWVVRMIVANSVEEPSAVCGGFGVGGLEQFSDEDVWAFMSRPPISRTRPLLVIAIA